MLAVSPPGRVVKIVSWTHRRQQRHLLRPVKQIIHTFLPPPGPSYFVHKTSRNTKNIKQLFRSFPPVSRSTPPSGDFKRNARFTPNLVVINKFSTFSAESVSNSRCTMFESTNSPSVSEIFVSTTTWPKVKMPFCKMTPISCLSDEYLIFVFHQRA